MPLILKKSLAQSNFVQSLIQKGAAQLKQVLVDWENHKLNPQLVTDLCCFVESEIATSSFKGSDIDRTALVTQIMIQVFGELTDAEKTFVETTIQFSLDHGLVKKSSVFGKLLSVASSLLL